MNIKVYQSGLKFMLVNAVKRLYGGEVIFHHSLDKGICASIISEKIIDKEELKRLKNYMNILVKNNLPFKKLLVSKKGLGYLIMYGSQVFNLNLVMTGIIILALLATLMHYLITIIEKIPLLGDIPVIGDMFFTRTYITNFIGIAIFIISYIFPH